MSKVRIEPAEKLLTLHLILEGKETQHHAVERMEISIASIQQWTCIFKCDGEGAFLTSGNKRYFKELKEQAVIDYLNGRGFQRQSCQRYGIRSKSKLQNWIKKFNGHEELKASGTGGTAIMTKGRKTTFDNRVEIVQYCITHNHNYAETAAKFGVSYQQARSYTIKYEAGGVDAIQDRWGRSKPVEKMSELEKPRAENRILRAEKKRGLNGGIFLKKLDEFFQVF